MLDLLLAIPDRGGVSRLQPDAASRELAQPAFDDLDLVAQDVDLRLFLLDELLGEPSQVREIDGLLADVQFLVELLGLVLQGPEMLGEIRRLAISPVRGRANSTHLVGLGVEQRDLLIDGVDLRRDPELRILAFEEDIQERQDRAKLGEVEERHHGCAGRSRARSGSGGARRIVPAVRSSS